MPKFTLGCDPELFLCDAASALVASCDKIGGTKHQPLPLPLGDGFAVQEDNVALEFNIPPSASQEEFTNNILLVMGYLRGTVNDMGLNFSPLSAASFPVWELMHPKALEFGCDPDFNAWENGKRNPRPVATDPTLRTAGGHVHIGYNFGGIKNIIRGTKYMDLYLGIKSVVEDKRGDERKKLYGRAGAFRPKTYGLEYRSLGNYWVFDKDKTDWVWNAVDRAIAAYEGNDKTVDHYSAEIQHIINDNNKVMAQTLIEELNL